MILVANFLSHHLNELARQYSAVLASALGESVVFEPDATIDEFREGRIGVAFICGLAYALMRDGDPERLAPVAAPVIADPRSADRAVYFSDIVVPAACTARSVADLEGARFAYNESVSFSGYRALEHALAARGHGWGLFAERIHTGSHRRSLEALASGGAEVAAVDSHVLLMERQRDSALAGSLRVLESLGPYPAPPLALHRIGCDVSQEYLYQLLDRVPVAVRTAAGIDRWQPVEDSDYDVIRRVTAGLPGLEIQPA